MGHTITIPQFRVRWNQHKVTDMPLFEERTLCIRNLLQRKSRSNQWPDLIAFDIGDQIQKYRLVPRRATD
jgi:hypothetical protein